MDLDGGDIFMALKAQDPNADPVQIMQFAYQLGWTTQNKRRFNKTLIRKRMGTQPPIVVCPGCKVIGPLSNDSIAVTLEE